MSHLNQWWSKKPISRNIPNFSSHRIEDKGRNSNESFVFQNWLVTSKKKFQWTKTRLKSTELKTITSKPIYWTIFKLTQQSLWGGTVKPGYSLSPLSNGKLMWGTMHFWRKKVILVTKKEDWRFSHLFFHRTI
jgi:hypothetical protein